MRAVFPREVDPNVSPWGSRQPKAKPALRGGGKAKLPREGFSRLVSELILPRAGMGQWGPPEKPGAASVPRGPS